MKRPKCITGLCGVHFIQDDLMHKGEIHLTCERDRDYWLRTYYSEYDVQEEVNDVCKGCEHWHEYQRKTCEKT